MTFRAWLDRTFWPGLDAPKQPCLRIASMSPERQAKIKARTDALLAEHEARRTIVREINEWDRVIRLADLPPGTVAPDLTVALAIVTGKSPDVVTAEDTRSPETMARARAWRDERLETAGRTFRARSLRVSLC